MALTLDGSVPMPMIGGTSSGVGAGALGGGAVGLLAGLLLGNGGFGGGWGNRGPAADAAATSVVLNPAFQSLQNQISNLNTEVDNNQILAGITSVNQNISGTSRDIGRDIANLSTAAATQNFTTLQSINGLGSSIVAAQTQALINNLQNFNTLQGTMVNSTNQIIAGQNAQNATFAECCCSIKNLIQSDGNATRALINDLNVQNLRDQLASANNKVSNNEQNQYLLSTILTHLHPVVSTAAVS